MFIVMLCILLFILSLPLSYTIVGLHFLFGVSQHCAVAMASRSIYAQPQLILAHSNHGVLRPKDGIAIPRRSPPSSCPRADFPEVGQNMAPDQSHFAAHDPFHLRKQGWQKFQSGQLHHAPEAAQGPKCQD